MNPVELIRKKRTGGALNRDELQFFVGSYVRGELPEYQMAAFLMAVCFNGMTPAETATLTEVMLHSGEVIDLSPIPGIKVDKHSTGGVGDKVSLILAPMVAACGVPVPMITGRGLGHTGGTLDKLESIPGFRTDFSIIEYRQIIADTGLVMIGQTAEIAPADRKMYALRDVTATVESIPLIAGSIMSKKLAEGIDALVLDVKTGNGAFMKSDEDAAALARTLVDIGTSMGKTTVGFLTDMNQPLGLAVGNWCEVVEAIDCLRGKNVTDLMEVTYVLGGAMVYLGGKAESIEGGMKLCKSVIWSGKAYEKFLELVARQGGDPAYIERPDRYRAAKYMQEVCAPRAGYVTGFDTMHIGVIAVGLGAGRQRIEDRIDAAAGILLRKKIGDKVKKGEPLAVIHTERKDSMETASRELAASIHISDAPVARPSTIRAFVDREGLREWVPPALY